MLTTRKWSGVFVGDAQLSEVCMENRISSMSQ